MYDEYGEPSETLVMDWNEHNDHADGAEQDEPEPDTAEFCPSTLTPGDGTVYGCIKTTGHGGPHYSDDFEYAWTDPTDDMPVPETIVAVMHAARTRFDDRLNRATGGESDAYDVFAHVADITAWLDASNPDSPHEDSMRVLKLVEESGEAAAAYIGMVGQNPRKGVTHTLDDLLGELADVALTALCAIQHFTRDQAATRATLAAKTHRIIARSDIPRARP